MYLEFKDEMLIPQINGEIYFKIYELENWLRRICLTAYMKEYGADWISHIPFQIVNRVRSRSKQNENFFYFDLDSDENLIWAVTQGELMTILLDDAIAHQVKDLTGFSKSALSQKLEELKGIRNMLAHNRALTSTASTIFTGITVSLFQGIKIFKERILYPPLGHIRVESEIIEYFNMGMDDNDWSKFQAFISLDNGIYSIACLPASGSSGTYPSAYKLLLFYKEVLEEILAFTCNKLGDEYCVLFPEVTNNAIKKNIIDAFIQSRDAGIDDVWTNTRFEEQSPKYVCNPKIWFYEHQRPTEE